MSHSRRKDGDERLDRIEALMKSADASIEPVAPSDALRARLLATLAGPARFAAFVPDLSKHFDLDHDAVRGLLGKIDLPASWEAGPFPGISLIHFAGGPHAAGPDTGFVRFAKGLHFPMHRHVGFEVNYVLEGTLRDGDGTLYLAGQAIVKTAGSQHEFFVGPERDALVAVAQRGFEIV